MLTHRKQSLLVPAPGEATLADYGPDDTVYEKSDVEWVSLLWVRRLFRFCALLSLVSVSANTPETFKLTPWLIYATLGIDSAVTLLYTIEMLAKIHIRGAFRGDRAYFTDRWCRFDFTMLLFLWISIGLHLFEIMDSEQYLAVGWLSVLRAPRPLIMIRFIRVFLQFNLPKSRINQIFKRASQQISNVTLFFLFFMSLYGIVGVQFFGPLEHHCVVINSTLDLPAGPFPARDHEVHVSELQIPDSFCSPYTNYGYQCPSGMVCERLRLDRHQRGYSGFDEFRKYSLPLIFKFSASLPFLNFPHFEMPVAANNYPEIKNVSNDHSDQHIHRLPSSISRRMGIAHVSHDRFTAGLAWFHIFYDAHFLPCLASQKRFHCRHCRNICRHSRTLPTNVGHCRSCCGRVDRRSAGSRRTRPVAARNRRRKPPEGAGATMVPEYFALKRISSRHSLPGTCQCCRVRLHGIPARR